MSNFLKKKRILITAGPTREYLDPVRYLTNPSSGEMGLAIAEALASRGARVTVVHGPIDKKTPRSVKTIPVVSAVGMHRAVKRHIHQSDVFIATAAVSDWRFAKIHSQKMKKGKSPAMTLRLVRNPDILLDVSQIKRNQILIGFALETKNVDRAMRNKLKQKNLDLIIGNSPASFASGTIKPLWLEKSGAISRFSEMSKKALAEKMSDWLNRQFKNG